MYPVELALVESWVKSSSQSRENSERADDLVCKVISDLAQLGTSGSPVSKIFLITHYNYILIKLNIFDSGLANAIKNHLRLKIRVRVGGNC